MDKWNFSTNGGILVQIELCIYMEFYVLVQMEFYGIMY
jgi:hypothetical protein